MEPQAIDTLIAASIGALAAIFFAALMALIFICRRQYKMNTWNRFDDRNSIYKRRKRYQKPDFAMALGDIGHLNNTLEQILKDQQWVADVSGLIPHCLAILRTCHSLTENLANLAMSPGIKNPANRLIETAKRIPFRVDDFAQAMYPPLDPRLLEAKATALVLAVGQLAILTQSTVGTNKPLIEQSLQEMDQYLIILRKASIDIEKPN